MWSKTNRVLNTIYYLKPIQFFYRGLYLFKSKLTKNLFLKAKNIPQSVKLTFYKPIAMGKLYEQNEFTFLNRSKYFKQIDWNFSEYGKLWCYNLNYFDFLNQLDISKGEGFNLINNYIQSKGKLKDGLESYPISLRNINWIKFLSKYGSTNIIDSFLYGTYLRLTKNLEYHLLGNHLIENGFSLLFGAYYFRDTSLLKQAAKIVKTELEEQVLEDGCHFELSPMYHQVILYRLMDCINLMKHNSWPDNGLYDFMEQKASKMLGWLAMITFQNGMIPWVNDSTEGIAPSSQELFEYAKRLGIPWKETKLGESGYRMVRRSVYELFIDVGNIGPDYIPGHAHSDTFNFVLHVNASPVIVDTGISTYEKNKRRQIERSTSSHNTVEVNGRNQSDVWGGFRVGKRAKIIKLIEKDNEIKSCHDGYEIIGVSVSRTWKYSNDQITIIDEIQGMKESFMAMAFLHFHPGLTPILKSNTLQVFPVEISFNGHDSISLKDYYYCEGFNKTKKARKTEIKFTNNLVCSIKSLH